MNGERGFSTGSVILSFVLGGLVGAGIALLTAPQSGRETREKIKGLADDTRKKASEYTGTVRDRLSSTLEEGKHYVEEKRSLISSAVEAGKEAYTKEKERLSKG